MPTVCLVPGCEGPVLVKKKGWCNKHYRRWLRTGDPVKVAWERGDPVANFWAKVQRREPSECWLWTGSLMASGHAHFVSVHGALAHRFAYATEVGPIPDGLELDHTCHSFDLTCKEGNSCMHRRCVNPAHLEPVTRAENQRRRHDLSEQAAATIGARQRAKTHCPKGHEYTEANTYVDRRGSRNCRSCAREKSRERSSRPEVKAKMHAYYLKRRAAAKQA